MTNVKFALAFGLFAVLAAPALAHESGANAGAATSRLYHQSRGVHASQALPAGVSPSIGYERGTSYAPGLTNYDRAVNGSDASTPGHN